MTVVSLVGLASCGGGDEGPKESNGSRTVSAKDGGGRVAPGRYFSDITKAVGIDFVHEWGAGGKKFMPETVGGGGALADFDGDGRLDVYFVNQAAMPGARLAERPVNRLYLQREDGTFRDAGAASGADDPSFGMGCAVADYDGDGDADILVCNLGGNRLLRNRGDATFEDVTAFAGLDDESEWSVSAIFLDYDNDADLDVFVVNYVEWSLEGNVDCYQGGRLAYCSPAAYAGRPNTLYRNDGDGRFHNVTKEVGIAAEIGKGLGVAVADYDGDGFVDIYVANDGVRNFMFHNQGGKRFEEVGVETFTAYNESGNAEAGMGVDFADLDDNGHPDIVVTNLDNELNNAFMNSGDGFFTEQARGLGLGKVSNPFVGFGVRMFDYENDGDLDVFVVNGHITDNIGEINPEVLYEQDDFLFVSDGKGRMEEVLRASGDVPRRVGRGLATGDVDDDGDLDLLVINNNAAPMLLRNDQTSKHGWVGLHLIGSGANRAALGAVVTYGVGDRVRRYRNRQRGTYVSAHDPRLLFGLGAEKFARDVVVTWPGGRRQELGDLACGHYYRVEVGKKLVEIR